MVTNSTDIRQQLRDQVAELEELREADHRLIALQHTMIEHLKDNQANLEALGNCLVSLKNDLKNDLKWVLWDCSLSIALLTVVLLLC